MQNLMEKEDSVAPVFLLSSFHYLMLVLLLLYSLKENGLENEKHLFICLLNLLVLDFEQKSWMKICLLRVFCYSDFICLEDHSDFQ
jgi:hypothetical protein